MLTPEAVDAYLHRMGTKRPERPTVAALHELHERHVLSIPFENIDFNLRLPINMGADAVPKITEQRRGGGCYELNGAFSEVLRALGYDVTVMSGRVVEDGELGPLMGHLILRVIAEDSPERWLVDVGYGRGFRHPLRLDSRAPQEDPQGTFELREAADGDLDVYRNGSHQYRFETRPRTVDDFRPTLWWFRSADDSPFLTQLFCTRPTPRGRVTLSGRKLVQVVDGTRTKEELADDEAVFAAYRTHFGFDLDALPTPPAPTG
ncbi:arylamine N-acetyltransferase family protein [Streptomyces endophytica]|uniref:Arylamine N-acetyltransferase n=1 Tax=Streptomyces endophytica TaxID=2991496 RepID=A0ABY6P6Q4_9ACTN|nr:arylamine N-acetyltransferase [Streptomyces endophytica]UZJ29473.1 arylamine N-acetyltransferase [Streptomyces endophytica]